MDFKNDAKRIVSDTVQAAVKKSGELLETAKVKYTMFDLRGEIRREYEEIGRAIYRHYALDEDTSGDVRKRCAHIEELNGRIAELDRSMAGKKREILCARCGRACGADMEFCPYCGLPLSDRESE